MASLVERIAICENDIDDIGAKLSRHEVDIRETRDDLMKRRGINASLIILSTIIGNGIVLVLAPMMAKFIH